MTVLTFARKVIDRHMTGAAHCFGCQHKWEAAAPVSTVALECPACQAMKGRFTNECMPPESGGGIWHCDCGNDLFRVTPDGTHCPNCGVQQIF